MADIDAGDGDLFHVTLSGGLVVDRYVALVESVDMESGLRQLHYFARPGMADFEVVGMAMKLADLSTDMEGSGDE